MNLTNTHRALHYPFYYENLIEDYHGAWGEGVQCAPSTLWDNYNAKC